MNNNRIVIKINNVNNKPLDIDCEIIICSTKDFKYISSWFGYNAETNSQL